MARFRILVFIILAIILMPFLAQPVYNRFSYWCIYFPQKGIQSQITPEEWNAALWMKENIPKDTILISDYFTMWVLTPLSNKVWAVEKSMDPPEQVPGLLPQLHYIKHNVFQANSSEEAFEAIINIKPIWVEECYLDYIKNYAKDNHNWVIVVSKRTSEWVRINGYYGFVWTWENIDIDSKLLTLFQDERYFKLAYKNDFLYVYVTNRTR